MYIRSYAHNSPNYALYAYAARGEYWSTAELSQNSCSTTNTQALPYTPPNEQYKRNTRLNGLCAYSVHIRGFRQNIGQVLSTKISLFAFWEKQNFHKKSGKLQFGEEMVIS